MLERMQKVGDVIALIQLAIDIATFVADYRAAPTESRALLQDLRSMERLLALALPTILSIQDPALKEAVMEQLRIVSHRVQDALDLVAKFRSALDNAHSNSRSKWQETAVSWATKQSERVMWALKHGRNAEACRVAVAQSFEPLTLALLLAWNGDQGRVLSLLRQSQDALSHEIQLVEKGQDTLRQEILLLAASHNRLLESLTSMQDRGQRILSEMALDLQHTYTNTVHIRHDVSQLRSFAASGQAVVALGVTVQGNFDQAHSKLDDVNRQLREQGELLAQLMANSNRLLPRSSHGQEKSMTGSASENASNVIARSSLDAAATGPVIVAALLLASRAASVTERMMWAGFAFTLFIAQNLARLYKTPVVIHIIFVKDFRDDVHEVPFAEASSASRLHQALTQRLAGKIGEVLLRERMYEVHKRDGLGSTTWTPMWKGWLRPGDNVELAALVERFEDVNAASRIVKCLSCAQTMPATADARSAGQPDSPQWETCPRCSSMVQVSSGKDDIHSQAVEADVIDSDSESDDDLTHSDTTANTNTEPKDNPLVYGNDTTKDADQAHIHAAEDTVPLSVEETLRLCRRFRVITIPLAPLHRNAPYKTLKEILALKNAVNAFQNAALVAKNEIEVAPEIADTAQKISSAIARACDREHIASLPVLASAHVAITTEMVVHCTALLVSDPKATNWLAKERDKSDRTAQLKARHEALKTLKDMFQIDKGVAMLLVNPAKGLELSNADPYKDRLGLERFSAVDSTIKIALTAMANVCDGAMWPLKAVPQTLLQFISLTQRSLEQSDQLNALVGAICRRVDLLLTLFGEPGRFDDEELNTRIEIFFSDTQRIIIRLRCIQAMSAYKSIVVSEEVAKVAIEEEALMRDSVADLQTYGIYTGLIRTQKMHKSVDKIHAAVVGTPTEYGTGNELVTRYREGTPTPQRRLSLRSQATENMSLHAPVPLPANGAFGHHHAHLELRGTGRTPFPPPRPQVFYGRDTEINRIVTLALDKSKGNARLGIKGTAGIGKTDLALTVLNDKRVKTEFGSSRIFLRCRDLAPEKRNADGLLCELALKLGLTLGGDILSDVITQLEELDRVIIVMDALEAVWSPIHSTADAEVERFMDAISSIAEVVLMVTVRGTALPQNVRWANHFDKPLGTLPLDAARAAFLDLTECEAALSNDERAPLDELLNAVDRHPQSIQLLARLGDPPSSLLKEWNAKPTGGLRSSVLLKVST